jgi:hypothetical protein
LSRQRLRLDRPGCATAPLTLSGSASKAPGPGPGHAYDVAYRGWVRHIESDRARVAMVASYQAMIDDAGRLETAAAAAHVAATLPADVKVATQGHVLVAGDFLATLAVEATIHHLDLAAGDESLAGPSGPGLAAVRETLDGALGQPVPVGWDDADYALKATGRAELSAGDQASLGVLAARFPLLG